MKYGLYYIFAAIILVLLCLEAYLNSPAVKGRMSERKLVKKLEADMRRKKTGRILTNVYIPKDTGDTTETDVLYLTTKGLLFFENKNYAGYIFGSEGDKSWTVTLPAGKKAKKIRFYNPIWQNHTHIKYMQAFLGEEIKSFSLVTFSDRGDLKNISVKSEDVYVCKHAGLSRVLKGIWDSCPDVLDEGQIEALYEKLLPLTQSSPKLCVN